MTQPQTVVSPDTEFVRLLKEDLSDFKDPSRVLYVVHAAYPDHNLPIYPDEDDYEWSMKLRGDIDETPRLANKENDHLYFLGKVFSVSIENEDSMDVRMMLYDMIQIKWHKVSI